MMCHCKRMLSVWQFSYMKVLLRMESMAESKSFVIASMNAIVNLHFCKMQCHVLAISVILMFYFSILGACAICICSGNPELNGSFMRQKQKEQKLSQETIIWRQFTGIQRQVISSLSCQLMLELVQLFD